MRLRPLSAALFLLALAPAQLAQAAPCDYQFGTVSNECYTGPGAGGICVAASFINGMVYLQNAFPSVYGGTALPTGNLSSQKAAMEAWAVDGWTAPNNTFNPGYYSIATQDGKTFGDFWQGMVAWTEAFAPGRTAYSGQAPLSLNDETSASLTFGNNLQNLFPTVGFLSAAANANDYVELSIYEYTRNGDDITTGAGHAINLANITCDNGQYTIYYQDPNAPTSGFFSAVLNTMDVDGQTALHFASDFTFGGQDVLLATAFAEGPDVPEPATLSLLGLAALALRRKRQ